MKIILVTISLIVSISVHAQDSLYYYQEAKTWEFGPRIGFTTSAVLSTGNPNLERGVRFAIVGGAFARYQLADQWALHGDLSYSSRGNKNDFNTVKNGYVDFSVVAVRIVKYRMFKSDMTFDFFLGPGISILTDAKIELITGTLTEVISPTEFNIVIGGGLPFGPFLLTATNRIGLSNLLDDPQPGSTWTSFTTEWTIAYRLK